VINEAHAQRAAARAELDGAPAPDELTNVEVHAMIDSLGDVGAALLGADPENLERLYGMLRLELLYHPLERTVDARLAPRVVSACVRGGIEHSYVAFPLKAGAYAIDLGAAGMVEVQGGVVMRWR